MVGRSRSRNRSGMVEMVEAGLLQKTGTPGKELLESPFPNMTLDNDGKNGEDCGIVTINDTKVIAIGGASGYSLAPEFYNPSDSGGAGYPAARNWSAEELELEEDVVKMVDGGFTGGNPQFGSWEAPKAGCQGISGGWTNSGTGGAHERTEEITGSWADGCVGGSGYYQFFPDCNKTNWACWGYKIGGSSGACWCKGNFGGNRWFWWKRRKYYH